MSRVIDAILNSFAAALEATGNYRVLRRLPPQEQFSTAAPAEPFSGIILDTEATGMTPGTDEVIELGMIKFQYRRDGQIYRALDTFNCLQQPSKPIPPHITAITGITDAEIAGQAIDAAAVEAFVSGAELITAHNAKFERPMCEATWPFFHKFNWACSYVQIPRRDEGHEGTKRAYLLNDYGNFHNGHRAIDDCRALLHLLAQPLPRSKREAMSLLLDNVRKTEFQLWAENAPFQFKDVLKGGARWDGAPRCWDIVLDEAALPIEVEFSVSGYAPNLQERNRRFAQLLFSRLLHRRTCLRQSARANPPLEQAR